MNITINVCKPILMFPVLAAQTIVQKFAQPFELRTTKVFVIFIKHS